MMHKLGVGGGEIEFIISYILPHTFCCLHFALLIEASRGGYRRGAEGQIKNSEEEGPKGTTPPQSELK